MPTVMITGANRGLGFEFTRQFADRGWQVIACCRHPDTAAELQQLIVQQPSVQLHVLDINDLEQIQRLSVQLKDQTIDILLNNAAIFGPRGIELGEMDQPEIQAWLDVFQTNCIAPWLTTQAFVSQVARSERKLVAMMSSRAGSLAENTSGGMPIYRSSKTALNQVVRCLSLALKPQEITVAAVHPGWVHTEMGGAQAPLSPEESVRGLIKVLLGMTLSDSGGFFDYQGLPVQW